MSKLTPVSRKELIGRLNKLGFEGPVQEGNIDIHGEKIGVNLLLEILRKAKISRDEWLSSQ